jgi:formylglycine-generating enzyme required for sulfatase activity
MELFLSHHSAGTTIDFFLTEITNITLVWCPKGEFIMGSPEENQHSASTDELQHKVILTQGFWISQTPVIQEVWEAIMEYKFRFREEPDSRRLPVEGMSWDTAMEFCDRLTQLLKDKGILNSAQRASLPTESQWEYACRAGTQTRWYFGNEESQIDHYAWYRGNSGDVPHPVGLKKPNSWGIYDLYGNVAEWCLDNYYRYELSEAVDPCYLNEDSQLKIVCGGAYNHLAKECCSASRQTIARNNPFTEETGIRIVCITGADTTIPSVQA